MAKSPHTINTWYNLQTKRLMLEREREDIPVLEGLENAWTILSNLVYTLPDEKTGEEVPVIIREEFDYISKTPVEIIQYYISSGIYPPPEYMLLLLEMFDYYFAKQGKVSLEHIFFGREVSGIGNYSAQKYRDGLHEKFFFYCKLEGMETKYKNLPKSSQVEIVEKFKNDALFGIANSDYDNTIDAESFLKKHRRWLKKKYTKDS